MSRAVALSILAALLFGSCTGPSRDDNGIELPAAKTSSQALNPDCPKEVPKQPGPNAREEAIAAAETEVASQYSNIDTSGYEVTNAYPASHGEGFGAIVYRLCGSTIGERTWVVTLRFPKMEPSASLSQGQLFLARFSGGWKVWFRYH